METRVVLAYDHHVFRQCLRAWLECVEDLTVVGEACDGKEALVEVERLRPDLLVTDLSLPGLSGLEISRRIVEAELPTRVLILSTSGAPPAAGEIERAGAIGFLQRESAPEDLFGAIRALQRAPRAAPPDPADAPPPRPPGTHDATKKLTHREREILQLITEGLSGRQIALRLGLSVRTVETHRAHMMGKLNVNKVSALVRLAIREGLVVA